MRYKSERHRVSATMRRLYDRGLTTCSGGNVSLRISSDIQGLYAITPAGLDKAIITPEQVAILSLSGDNLTPRLKPSIETGMHRQILSSHPHINAIVHAHPKHATLFTVAKSHVIRTDMIAEARYLLREPVFAPYGRMGTEALGERASSALSGGAVAVLLENHGIVTVGQTLLEAFDRMEVLEAAAQMTLMAHQLGDISPLTAERLQEIDDMHG